MVDDSLADIIVDQQNCEIAQNHFGGLAAQLASFRDCRHDAIPSSHLIDPTVSQASHSCGRNEADSGVKDQCRTREQSPPLPQCESLSASQVRCHPTLHQSHPCRL